MKKIIRKEKIPEEIIPTHEIEHEEYPCDVCDFISDDEEMVKEHYGKTHAAKKEREICGYTLMYFETESDCEVWCEAHDDGTSCDEMFTKWSEPGWYFLKHGSEPCGRGCCTKSVARITSARSLIWDLESDAARLSSKALKLRKELGLEDA